MGASERLSQGGHRCHSREGPVDGLNQISSIHLGYRRTRGTAVRLEARPGSRPGHELVAPSGAGHDGQLRPQINSTHRIVALLLHQDPEFSPSPLFTALSRAGVQGSPPRCAITKGPRSVRERGPKGSGERDIRAKRYSRITTCSAVACTGYDSITGPVNWTCTGLPGVRSRKVMGAKVATPG